MYKLSTLAIDEAFKINFESRASFAKFQIKVNYKYLEIAVIALNFIPFLSAHIISLLSMFLKQNIEVVYIHIILCD